MSSKLRELTLMWILCGYSWLLRLYPRTYRVLFAHEMRAVFAQALTDAARLGWSAIFWLCLREVRDLPQNVLTEYWLPFQHWSRARLAASELSNAERPGIVTLTGGSIPGVIFMVMSCHPRLRRLLDVAFALVAILIAAPLMLLLPLLIKVDSAGPILYRQTRLGKDGKQYTLLKFRSMHVKRPFQWIHLSAMHLDHTPHITRLGHLTRRHHLDELPQLFNVLKGEMSIFGPRPQIPH